MVHSTNPDYQLEEAKDIVINAIGETMDLYGINRSVGNLFGTMLFEDSMTLDEMREQLQMSKPSMSAGVKRLQNLILLSNNSHVEVENNILSLKKISLISLVISFHANGVVKLLLIQKVFMMQ